MPPLALLSVVANRTFLSFASSFYRLFVVSLLLGWLTQLSCSAAVYVWNGGTTGTWESNTSWLVSGSVPASAPSSSDLVSITSGSPSFSTSFQVTLAGLGISGGTLQLGANNLTVNGNTTMTGGAIQGSGTMTVTSGTVSFSNATIGLPLTIGSSTTSVGALTFGTGCLYASTVTAYAQSVYLNGGTFNGNVTFVNTGTADVNSNGGCTFKGGFNFTTSANLYVLTNITPNLYEGPVWMKHLGATYLRVAMCSGNHVFKSSSTFINNGANLWIGYTLPNATLRFEGVVKIINKTSSNGAFSSLAHDAAVECLGDIHIVNTNGASSANSVVFLAIRGQLTARGNIYMASNTSGSGTFAGSAPGNPTFSTGIRFVYPGYAGTVSTNPTTLIKTTGAVDEVGASHSFTSGLLYINNTSPSVTADNSFVTQQIDLSAGSAHLTVTDYAFKGALNILCNGTATLGAGATFNKAVTLESNSLLLNGSTFNGTADLLKKGSSIDASTGGNKFYGITKILNSGSGILYMANTAGDIFYQHLTIEATAASTKCTTFVAHNGMSEFKAGITLTNNSISSLLWIGRTSGTVQPLGSATQYGAKVYGDIKVSSNSATATTDKVISIGNFAGVELYDGTIKIEGGYTNGALYLQRINQIYTSPTSVLPVILNLTNNSSLGIRWCHFPGAGTFSAPALSLLQENVFGTANLNYTTNLTDLGNITFNLPVNSPANTDRFWAGGNIFHGPTNIKHSGAGNIYSPNTQTGMGSMDDEFNGLVTVENTEGSTGATHLAYSAKSTFRAGLTLNNLGSSSILWIGRTNGSAQPLGSATQYAAKVYGDIKVSSYSANATPSKALSIGNYAGVELYDGSIKVAGGFSNGALYLQRIKQVYTTSSVEPVIFTLTGTASLGMRWCQFPIGGTFSAPMLSLLQENVFGTPRQNTTNPDEAPVPDYSTIIIDQGNISFNNPHNNLTPNSDRIWTGGNIFHGPAIIKHNGAGNIYMAAEGVAGVIASGDVFHRPLTVENTDGSTGLTHVATGALSLFKEGITFNNFGTTSTMRLACTNFSGPDASPLLAKVTGDIVLNSKNGNNTKFTILGAYGRIEQDNGTIKTGTLFDDGKLYLRRITQTFSNGNPLVNNVVLSGTASLIMVSNIFPASGTFSAPAVFDIANNTFGTPRQNILNPNDPPLPDYSTTIIDQGNVSILNPNNSGNSDRYWAGGNTFHGPSTIKHGGAGNIYMTAIGYNVISTSGDVFNRPLIVENIEGSTGLTHVATSFLCEFKEGLTMNNFGSSSALRLACTTFGVGDSSPLLAKVTGDIVLNSKNGNNTKVTVLGAYGRIEQVNGIIKTASIFEDGKLYLRRITQTFTNGVPLANSVSLTGTASLIMASNLFPTGGTFTSPFVSEIMESTFGTVNQNYSFTLIDNSTSSIARTWTGGNTFLGPATFNYSGAGTLTTSNIKFDTFHGDVSVSNMGTASVLFAHSGVNTFNGNLLIKGPVSFNGGGGSSIFTGSSDQTIGLLSGATTPTSLVFPSTFTINKPSGKLILGLPITVNGTLNLTKGIVNTPYQVTVSTVTNANPLSYVSGPVIKTGTTPFTFPIGKDGHYAPITVNFPSTSSSIQAEYFAQTPPSATNLTAPVLGISDKEYWTLTDKQGNAPVVTTTLPWVAGRNLTNISSLSTALLATKGPSASSWSNVTATASGTSSSGELVGTQALTLGSANTFLTYGFNVNLLPKLILNTSLMNATTFHVTGSSSGVPSGTYTSGLNGTGDSLELTQLTPGNTVQLTVENTDGSIMPLQLVVSPDLTPKIQIATNPQQPTVYKDLARSYYEYDNSTGTLTFLPSEPNDKLFTTNLNGVALSKAASTSKFEITPAVQGLSAYSIQFYDKNQTLVSSSSGTPTIVGNVLTWNVASMASGVYRYVLSFNDADSQTHSFEGQVILQP